MADKMRIGANLVANAATIITSSLLDLGHSSEVIVDTGYPDVWAGSAGMMGLVTKRKRTIKEKLSPTYKAALFAVIALTVLSLIIEVGLAFLGTSRRPDFSRVCSER
jgi:hypothetical protein